MRRVLLGVAVYAVIMLVGKYVLGIDPSLAEALLVIVAVQLANAAWER